MCLIVHVFDCPCVHLCPYLSIDCLPIHLSTSWSVQLTANLLSTFSSLSFPSPNAYTGWKFNHWELKVHYLSVHLCPCVWLSMCPSLSISVYRLSACPFVYQLVCPADCYLAQFVAMPRVGGKKATIANSQAMERVKGMLEQFQEFLFDR